MELIAGIDLGTTNSEIAWFRDDGVVEVVPVDGDPVVPSCVGIDRAGKLLVGRPAKNQMVAEPESTVLSIKRRMGEETKVSLRDRSFSPEEISAFILAELKKRLEAHAGKPVTKAVITVPAYFNDRQRTATINAGTLAGLEVLRIINEPTAAALAYESDHGADQQILVYDLGGGTFDVSLVTVEKGVVEVRASHGDTHLGGDDFDNLLIEHILSQLGSRQDAIRRDLKALRRLLRAAEAAKRELSDAPFARIREEYILDDLNVDIEITREEYETMISPLLQKTLDCVHLCLRDAAMLPGAVDRIILAGGATRTPLVHNLIEAHFGKTPRYEVNPDLIVAIGAGLQAARIAGAQTRSVLVDITPYTFGTSAFGEIDGSPHYDCFVPIIKRNSPLPIRKSEVFYTMHDGQDMVEVTVCQGEDPIATNNTLIGKFMVEGLSNVGHGNPVMLNLDLDLNGVLKVTAVEKKTGLSKTVVMDTRKASSNGTLGESRANIADLIDDEIEEGETAEVTPDGHHRDVVDRAKELRKRAEKLLGTVNAEDSGELQELLTKSRGAIAAHALDELSALNDSISDMLFYLED
jgi:molecular chaperone DnaK